MRLPHSKYIANLLAAEIPTNQIAGTHAVLGLVTGATQGSTIKI